MDVDELIRRAFARDVCGVPTRAPGPGETARALDRAQGSGSAARIRPALGGRPFPWLSPGELAPLVALAAAVLIVAVVPAGRLSLVRPLASELSALVSEYGAEDVLDLVFAAGESYRSTKER